MSTTRHGLVIGKFYPPHLGHHHLIDSAADRAERLTVLVMSSSLESIPLDRRLGWLRQAHAHRPDVTFIGARCDIPMDLDSPTIWTAQVAVMQAAIAVHTTEPIDAVFSSESYGDELATRLGATHLCIDPARSAVHVSGTAVRDNLADQWALLHPVVRAGLATRIVVLGSESTGTTTVANALTEHYRARGGVWARTRCVPEYGRDYTYEKYADACNQARLLERPVPDMEDLSWTSDDFEVIAKTQTDMENTAAALGSPLLVCDTDAFATSVWEHRYAGPDSHGSDTAAGPDLPARSVYLVTDHTGVPFVQDGWRDGEHIRADMTGWFIQRLAQAGHSWCLLSGTLDERVALAIRVTDAALARQAQFTRPMSAPTVLEPVAT